MSLNRKHLQLAVHILLALAVGFAICNSLPASASKLCKGRILNPISDVDWDGLFPITIGGLLKFSGENPDTENPGSPVCMCSNENGLTPVRIGLSLGYWEPIALIEVVRHPGCFPSLGGISFPIGSGQGGSWRNTFGREGQANSFYHVHYYPFPALSLLNAGLDVACMSSSLNLSWFSEFDPSWRDDQLAMILNPEAVLFATPAAQAVCAADATAVLVKKLPIDKLFWCAGTQGGMYPLDGYTRGLGGIRSALLLAERMLFKLHRMHMMQDSVGSDGVDLCRMHSLPLLPKSRYRLQMVYPKKRKAEPIGRYTDSAYAGVLRPDGGEDFVFLVWRKRNCCAF